MSGQIRVSPETLKERARSYGQASNEVNTILTNLTRLQEQLRSEWEGQAFQGFDAQFQELKPKVQNFAELLQQINVQLDRTADAMTQRDIELQQGFGLK